MIKNVTTAALTLLMTLIISMSPVYAEDKDVSGSASADAMSNYVWRGIKLSNAYVVQPSVGIGFNGLGANLWANWDSDCTLSTCNRDGELTETDLTLNYAFSVDKLSIDLGYIYYALEDANDTQEFYVSAGYETLLSPALTVYYDVEEGSGAFAVASISHSFDLSKGIALNLGSSASYNIENLVMGTDSEGNEFSGLYNGEVSASLSIPVTDVISVEPKAAYSFPLSNDAETAIEAMSDDNVSEIFYGGLSVSLSF